MGKIRNHHSESKSWNIESVIREIKAMLALKKQYMEHIDDYHVFISPINSKGAPNSVSTIPGANCPNCLHCLRDCYDLRHDTIMETVKKTRARNAAILECDPERFFREISGACKAFDRFRWYVGGDVDSMTTFCGIVRVAIENPHCLFHLFTKNHKVVNKWIDENGDIPSNLHLRLSEWVGMKTVNPHNLNLCSVFSKNDFFEVHEHEAVCTGNCTECAIHTTGCFNRDIKRVWIAKH